MSLWLLYHCKTFNSTNALHGLTMRSWHRFGSVIMNKYLIFSNITHNIIGSDALKKGANKAMSVIVYFFYVLCHKTLFKWAYTGLYTSRMCTYMYMRDVCINIHVHIHGSSSEMCTYMRKNHLWRFCIQNVESSRGIS